jgi:hypothetical protein
MENPGSEIKKRILEKRPISWEEEENYLKRKNSIVSQWKQPFRDTIDNNESLFPNASGEDKELISEGLAVFVFGVERVHKRLGRKQIELNFTFSPDGLKNGHMVGVVYDGPEGEIEYGVDPKEITKAVKSRDIMGRLNGRFGGLEKPYFLDMMEIAGVEEGDRYLFLLRKKSEGRPGVKNIGLGYEYYTSDIEYSALLRKLSYCRQYKTRYVEELELTQFQARKSREAAGYYDKR